MSITDDQWADATTRCTCHPGMPCDGCDVCDRELDPELPCPAEDDGTAPPPTEAPRVTATDHKGTHTT